MRLVLVSDTHNMLDKVLLPEGDLLIHAGDATFNGSSSELEKFNRDLVAIKGRYTHGILFVPGNHDFMFQDYPEESLKIVTEPKILIDQVAEMAGFRFYGSPWTPEFGEWAFMLPRGKAMKEKWDKIPEECDVLITHGPPRGILDLNPTGINCGCGALNVAINRVQPALHSFGHIHGGYGVHRRHGHDDTLSVNAAICDESYRPVNSPIVVEYREGAFDLCSVE